MSIRKITVSGRTSVAALSILVLLVLAGGFLIARKSSAQVNPGGAAQAFAPILTNPPDPDRKAGNDSILIGLLLPAVQKGTGFGVEVVMGDGSVRVLQLPADPKRQTAFFDVFFTLDVTTGGYVMHLQRHGAREGGITAPAPDTSVVVRILPAVQSNGRLLRPLSAGLTVTGNRNTVLADGSVLPIPFTYGLQLAPESNRGG